jgi:hypothetical protein
MQEQSASTVYTRQQLLNTFRLLSRLVILCFLILYIVIATLLRTDTIVGWVVILLPFAWFPSLFIAHRWLIRLAHKQLAQRHPKLRSAAIVFDRLAFYTIVAQANFLIAFALVPILEVLNDTPQKYQADLALNILTFSLWVVSVLIGMGGSLFVAIEASRDLGGSRLLGGISLLFGCAFTYIIAMTLTSLQSDLLQRFSLPPIFFIFAAFQLLFSAFAMHFLVGKKVKNREFLLSKSY